uniref:Venom S1 protease 19 n=1 Tax=Lethocerus distinctifemur TaxID=280095 RepID=A0A2K8JU79_9HEMI|nr:venom S1 protease 19 [Lethocerus distinctifemur]
MKWQLVLYYLLSTANQILVGGEKSYLTEVSKEVNSDEYGQSRGKISTNCTCGWTNKAVGRIVGGRETEVNEYPFMVALVQRLGDGRTFAFCGAAILTNTHALTAAHCVADVNTPLAIIVGEHDLTTSKETQYTKLYGVAMAIPHEGYNSKTHRADIALLVTDSEIQFNKAVGPACLPRAPIDLLNKYVKITGWGHLKHEGKLAKSLMKVWVRVIPQGQCAAKFAAGKVDTENPTQFCTYGWNKDACQGDSGGPVTWLDPDTNRYTLVGVVSFGIGCATTRPGVNTHVFAYIDWIHRNIKKTSLKDTYTCARL